MVKVTKEHVEEAKKLLTLMGVPYVEALCEAEAQCAQMCLEGNYFFLLEVKIFSFLTPVIGLVHAVSTEDMDALCFKTPTLLRRLTMPEARKLPVQEISYEKLMAVLGLTHDEFVDLCILMGCDYVPNIRGIGPKKAFELIKFGSKICIQIYRKSGLKSSINFFIHF